ncbi:MULTISPECIES: FadR/GntR family transcriptional regulator [unclassified Mycobacterium]|uniref:FadR/GntR family transcriptional regulator n=1 Tax=unclassified Mycobacterium TaxID=2642494 RepID=UPI0029C77946|nr:MULTISPECIES: GntR family transcriptional regulator [unclassified Mycobacterium]
MTRSNFTPPGSQRRVRPLKMSDQVAAHIRRMIAHGELVEGDYLPTEAELIQRFGVSRPTLREAFRLLEGASLVNIRRGPPGGARVTVPGPDAAANLFGMVLMLAGTTIGDVWEARLTVEPAAVRRLAESATEVEIAALDAELATVHAAAALDPLSFYRAGVKFHVKLVELSGNRTLSAVIAMLSEIIERELGAARDKIALDRKELARANRQAVRGYERVADIIRAGDGPGAEQGWYELMHDVRRYVGKTQYSDQVLDVL